jgi:hypothetical protein
MAKPWIDKDLKTHEARIEFERQHEGRNLRQHHLRGTYTSVTIAALWNQHLRTIKWMERPERAAKPESEQV